MVHSRGTERTDVHFTVPAEQSYPVKLDLSITNSSILHYIAGQTSDLLVALYAVLEPFKIW